MTNDKTSKEKEQLTKTNEKKTVLHGSSAVGVEKMKSD